MPLSGRGTTVVYAGTRAKGFQVSWGTLSFQISREDLDEIDVEFGGRTSVPLGAAMAGAVPSDSLGPWLVDNGWPSRRYASAIATVMHAEGLVSGTGG
jgi:hypothetical protein